MSGADDGRVASPRIDAADQGDEGANGSDVSSDESTGGEPPVLGMVAGEVIDAPAAHAVVEPSIEAAAVDPPSSPGIDGMAAHDTEAGEEGSSGDVDISDAGFFGHSRHFFVISFAGKPIYSRHGDESRLATLLPFVSAIIMKFEDQKDDIECIVAGKYRFVFCKRDPLYLLAVSDRHDPTGLLAQQMDYLYEQIVSLVTSTHIEHLRQNPKADISRHITGAEHVVKELVDTMDESPCFLLDAWNCLPMDPAIRKEVTQTIQAQRSIAPDIKYGLMMAQKQVVTFVEPKREPLDPADLLLLINFVSANAESFQTSSSNFTHICLPRAWGAGWHHVYICFLKGELALVFVTTNVEAFEQLHNAQAGENRVPSPPTLRPCRLCSMVLACVCQH